MVAPVVCVVRCILIITARLDGEAVCTGQFQVDSGVATLAARDVSGGVPRPC